jgi:hypothetical protein
VKHFAVYTLARITLFLTCWFAIWGIGRLAFETPESFLLWSLVIAAVLSSVLSLKLLEGPRERFAQSVEDRAARAAAKFEEMKSKEDVD